MFIQGDIIESLKTMKEKFDLIITDPPYNIKFGYKGIGDNRNDYRNWCIEWCSLCLNRLNDNGNFLVINYPENNNILYTDLKDKGFNIKQQLIWRYNTNIGMSKRKYTRSYRTILHIIKSKNYIFNPIKGEYKNKTDKRIKLLIEQGKAPNHYDIFEYQLCKNLSKDKKEIGMNQLPYNLVKDMILSYSNINSKVLDPFVGNGTSMNIANELGREGWGIDIVKRF